MIYRDMPEDFVKQVKLGSFVVLCADNIHRVEALHPSRPGVSVIRAVDLNRITMHEEYDMAYALWIMGSEARMDTRTDFSDQPQTITEIKAGKLGSAEEWTPKDALIACLRDIDRGRINPEVLVVSYKQVEDKLADGSKGSKFGYFVSSPNLITTLGLLTTSQHDILNNDRGI